MELIVVEKGDKAFNEAVLEMQQQVLLCKERTSHKFQKLEELIELAAQKLSILMNIEAKQQEEGFSDAFGWKDKDCEHQLADFGIGNRIQGWPNLAEEENAYASWEAYTGEPIYDEEPGEGQECWIEKEFILAALKGGNSRPSNPLQSALCTIERLEVDDLRNKPTKILEGGDKPKLVDYNGEEQQGTVEEEHPIILTNKREELTEDVFGRDGQTVANSSGLDKSSSHLENKNMIIFDPGGFVQEDHSKGVNHNSKDMIRSEMQLEETVMKDSVGSKLRHWQDFDFLAIGQQLLMEPSQLQRKVIIETKISAGLQGQGQNIQKESDGFDKIVGEINQQFVDFVRTEMIALPYQYQYMVLGPGRPEMNKSMRPESHEALRKSVAICIFDPGGDLSSLHGVQVIQLVVSVGSKTCYLNHYPRCKDRWREVKKCKIHHEDMVVF